MQIMLKMYSINFCWKVYMYQTKLNTELPQMRYQVGNNNNTYLIHEAKL